MTEEKPEVEPPHKLFGERLQQLMDERKLKVPDLVRKTGFTFVSCQKWKRGQAYPRPQAMIKLAKALEVDVDDLTNLRRELPTSPLVYGEATDVDKKYARIKQLETLVAQHQFEIEKMESLILMYQTEVRQLKDEIIKDFST